MFGKIICNRCNGNGFIMVYRDASCKEKRPMDCSECNNQGEIPITIEDLQLDKTPEKTQ